MAGAERVSIILVTYDSAAVLPEALASIPTGAEVIVADNASTDGSVAVARAAGARVVPLPGNLGFGTACNAGAREATRELLLFLNPDARLAPGALEHLVHAADLHPEAAAFNPRILRDDGRVLFRTASHLLPGSLGKKVPPPAADCEMRVLSGAALFCRRAAFTAIGGFDERIFLYHEDDDLTLRLRQTRATLRYVHAAVVRHQGDGSTAAHAGLDEFKAYHMIRSRRFVMQKHGVPFHTRLRTIDARLRWLGTFITRDDAARARYRGFLRALTEPVSGT